MISCIPILFSLKAEWMYSQSKARHFSPGQHSELAAYLAETCPLNPDKDWQEDEKLNLVLSKVHEHQLSLRSNDNPGKTKLRQKQRGL